MATTGEAGRAEWAPVGRARSRRAALQPKVRAAGNAQPDLARPRPGGSCQSRRAQFVAILRHFANATYDVIQIFLVELRMAHAEDEEFALMHAFGDRTNALLITNRAVRERMTVLAQRNALLVQRGEIKRLHVAHSDGDAFRPHRIAKDVSGNAQFVFIVAHRKEIVRVGGAMPDGGRNNAWNLRQHLRELLADLLPFSQQRRQLFQLLATDSGFYLGHAKVEAQQIHDVGNALLLYNRFAMIANQLHALGKAGIVGDVDATFASVNDLVAIEAEDADICQGAGELSEIFGAGRLGRVFDDDEPAIARQFHDGTHFCRLSEEVHHDDGLGARADMRLDAFSGDAEGFWLDVGKHRNGAVKQNTSRRGRHGIGRDDDFVARADAGGAHRRDKTAGG